MTLFRFIALLLCLILGTGARSQESCSESTLRMMAPKGAVTVPIAFSSPANLTWRDIFKVYPETESNQVRVPGLLILPARSREKVPAVIMISSSYAYHPAWENYVIKLLNDGIAAFVFDTYCPRGIT